MNVIKRFKRARNVAVSMQREEGLTLIEVLAVVVILGIVAAIAVPSVTKAIDQAKVNSTITTLGTLQSALSRYYFDEGEYPPNLTALADDTALATDKKALWQGPYIKGPFPMNDAWGNPVYYGYIDEANNASSTIGYVLLSGDGHVITPSGTSKTQLDLSTLETTNCIIATGGSDGTSTYSLSPTSVTLTGGSTSSTQSSSLAYSFLLAADDGNSGPGTFTDN